MLVREWDLGPWAKVPMAIVIAHEYAHHVQHLLGIGAYLDTARLRAGTRTEEQLLSRRSELQAECLAGVALSATGPLMPVWPLFDYLYERSQSEQRSRDHGKLATQGRWFHRGFSSGKPGSCNTWTSERSDVA